MARVWRINMPTPEQVQSFYEALWGTTPDITISFTVIGTGHKTLKIDTIFQTITA